MTKTGITSAPFLRGRSGSGNIKAWRGKAGWKEAQALKTKFKKGKKKVSKTGDAFVAGATGAAVHGAATAELKKDRKKKNTKGRTRKFGGGRTNLLEELGRVEGESSNRNRRAEVSRIHGELNKGYKGGKRVGLKHGTSPQQHYLEHGFGPHKLKMAKASDKATKGNKLTRKA